MDFNLLAAHLHDTAKNAINYFRKEHGANGVKIECACEASESLKPTFSGRLSNGYILCVEVSERAYSPSLDTFVVDCSVKSYPVKLFVVIPNTQSDQFFAANFKQAKERGVGVIELIGNKATVLVEAVPLSLFAVRAPEAKHFPTKYREAIRTATSTFRNGNPVKGCQTICEELEAITRKFAIASRKAGWWKAPPPGQKPKKINLENGAWAKVLEELDKQLDYKIVKQTCPLFSDKLVTKARALTDSRNLTSHKPGTVKEIIQRDRELRTIFENSCDVLRLWHDAIKPLKIKA